MPDENANVKSVKGSRNFDPEMNQTAFRHKLHVNTVDSKTRGKSRLQETEYIYQGSPISPKVYLNDEK